MQDLYLFVFELSVPEYNDESDEYEFETYRCVGIEARHLEEAQEMVKNTMPPSAAQELKYTCKVNRKGDPAIVFDC